MRAYVRDICSSDFAASYGKRNKKHSCDWWRCNVKHLGFLYKCVCSTIFPTCVSLTKETRNTTSSISNPKYLQAIGHMFFLLFGKKPQLSKLILPVLKQGSHGSINESTTPAFLKTVPFLHVVCSSLIFAAKKHFSHVSKRDSQKSTDLHC